MLAAAIAAIPVAGATAGPVTGNPNADGWDFNGNSLDKGTFVYAYFGNSPKDYAHLYNFDVYSTSFQLAGASALVGNGWQAGDLILGIGATVNQTVSLLPTVRILAKFGASDATFQASSFGPSNPIPPQPWSPPNAESPNFYGDGVGSSSYSGTGGVIVETPQIWGTNPPTTPWFNTTNEGSIVLLDGSTQPLGDPNGKAARVTRRNDPVTTNIDALGASKMIYQLNNPGDLLSSFETYMNVSLLERAGYAHNPAPGDKFVLAIQNVGDEFTKATGTIGAVPEPSSLVLTAVGLGGLGLTVLRRRSRSVV